MLLQIKMNSINNGRENTKQAKMPYFQCVSSSQQKWEKSVRKEKNKKKDKRGGRTKNMRMIKSKENTNSYSSEKTIRASGVFDIF